MSVKKIMKPLLCLCIALLFAVGAKAQFYPTWNGYPKIPWRPNLLTAQSFYRLPANSNKPWAAMTWWFMDWRWNMTGEAGIRPMMRVAVRSCFLKCPDSYIKVSSMNDTWLIHHEQGHLDIAEVYTREFAQALKKAHFSRANYSNEVQAVYERFLAACKVAQNKYDEDSAHCRNKAGQLTWDNWIRTRLSSTPSTPVVYVPVG